MSLLPDLSVKRGMRWCVALLATVVFLAPPVSAADPLPAATVKMYPHCLDLINRCWMDLHRPEDSETMGDPALLRMPTLKTGDCSQVDVCYANSEFAWVSVPGFVHVNGGQASLGHEAFATSGPVPLSGPEAVVHFFVQAEA